MTTSSIFEAITFYSSLNYVSVFNLNYIYLIIHKQFEGRITTIKNYFKFLAEYIRTILKESS